MLICLGHLNLCQTRAHGSLRDRTHFFFAFHSFPLAFLSSLSLPPIPVSHPLLTFLSWDGTLAGQAQLPSLTALGSQHLNPIPSMSWLELL